MTAETKEVEFKFYDSSKKTIEHKERFEAFCTRILGFDNLIVLAGSGTSLSFGKDSERNNIAPSMGDLWHECSLIKSTNPDREHQCGNDENGNSIIYPINYLLFDAVKKEINYNDKNNIEEFLSYVDKNLSFSNNSDKTALEEFKAKVIDKIHETTNFVLTKKDKLTDDKWQHHEQFINKLARRNNKQSRLKLFTTNYDQAFEKAASRQGFVVIDGFEFTSPARFNPMWYEYDIVGCQTSHNTQGSRYLDNVLHLYKLHGSVDWRRKDGGVFKTNSNDPDGEKVFIYPSSNKYQSSYDSPYLDMISAFTQALKAPNTALICVGFGFNDNHLSNAIKMALQTNTSLHVLAMAEKDNPDNPTKNQTIAQLFELAEKSPRIGIFDAYFDVFTKAFPNHANKSPELEVLENIRKILGGKNNE
jgi:hypothetical protein